MADLGRGVKAGIAAGVIAFLLAGIIGLALEIVFYDEIMAATIDAIDQMGDRLGMTDEQIERMKAETMERGIGPLQMVITLVFSAIGGVIVGVIFGLIYAAAYGMLPGKTPIAKGIVIGIIVFIVRLLFAFGIEALISSFMGMNVKISGVYEALNYVSTLVTSLIFGYLLGMFWVRFEPK